MEPIEIIIVIVGFILIIITYLLSEKFELGTSDIEEELSKNVNKIAEELVRREVEKELVQVIDEKIEAASVKLDKIANEKIMAVGNYSDEILEKISKNHDEVIFLYNMLNEKEATLKDTIRDIEALKLSIKKMAVVNDMAVASKETMIGSNKKLENEKKIQDKEEIQKTEKSQDAPLVMDVNPKSEDTSVNKNSEILIMYKNGKSNIEIAKELGIGMGEVRLVIDLFKKEN